MYGLTITGAAGRSKQCDRDHAGGGCAAHRRSGGGGGGPHLHRRRAGQRAGASTQVLLRLCSEGPPGAARKTYDCSLGLIPMTNSCN